MDVKVDNEENEEFSSENLLAPAKEMSLNISHPGINMKRFLDVCKIGYLPQELEIPILALEDTDNNPQSENVLKLWNELKIYKPKRFTSLLAMQKVVCGLVLLPGNFETVQLKMTVVNSTFHLTSNDWDTHPCYLHVICKELYLFLHNYRNMMFFIRLIASISRMGFNVAVCLAWTSFFTILRRDVKMHRFHTFQTMLDMLSEVDLKDMKSKVDEFYSLLDVAAFLTNCLVLRKTDEVTSLRFKDYFTISLEQIQEMINWAEKVENVVQLRSSNIENEDHVLLLELVQFDILEHLREILEEMQNDISF